MIIRTDDDNEIDTSRDLSSEECHILQKLLCYKAIVSSAKEFREKKLKAFRVGWNDSGPIKESRIMASIAARMEKEIDTKKRE